MTASQQQVAAKSGTAGSRPERPAAVTVQVLSDDAEVDRLAEEWEHLYARSAVATPFQSHAWISSWWRAYGSPGRLRLLVARREGELAGIAPFMLRHCGGYRVLAPIGGGLSDFTDILLEDDAEESALGICEAILAEPGWDVIDLPEVRPGAAIDRLRAHWRGRSWSLPASICLQLPAKPVDDLLDDLAGRNATKLRRGLRRLETMNIQMTEVPAGDVERGMTELIGLHAKQWENRNINQEHLRPQFVRHLTRAARLLIEQNRAVLTEYRIAGRLVVSDFIVVGDDFVGGYLYGAHPDIRSQIDILTLLVRGNLDLTHRIGRPALSFLRGSESHKTKWGTEEVRNHRVVLGRGLPALGYVAAARTRLTAERLIRAHFPTLVENRPRLSRHRRPRWR